jgi:hypothetical protein
MNSIIEAHPNVYKITVNNSDKIEFNEQQINTDDHYNKMFLKVKNLTINNGNDSGHETLKIMIKACKELISFTLNFKRMNSLIFYKNSTLTYLRYINNFNQLRELNI